MRKTFLAMCATVFAATSLSAQQQQARVTAAPVNGWRAAKWGMTPEQVLAAFHGEVVRLLDTASYGEKGEKARAVAPIGIEDFDLAGTRVNVRFLFSPDFMRLKEVLLQKMEQKPLMSSRTDYTRIAAGLTEKYGPAAFSQPERTSVDEKITTSWSFPETVIELQYWYMPDIVQMTSLRYRVVDQKARSVY